MKIAVKVIPRAKKERIEQTAHGLKVYIHEPALEGRANEHLIEVLAKHYNVKKSALAIVLGEKSRNKVIQIQ